MARPLTRLILLFVAVPLVELYLLVRIGETIGLGPTILLVLLTGALGATLARAQGLATWNRFQRSMSEGRLPGRELLEGILILVAAAVLLTPGILTDAIGFLLLAPPLRRWLVGKLARRMEARIVVAHSGASASGPRPGDDPRPPGDTIDADYEVRD